MGAHSRCPRVRRSPVILGQMCAVFRFAPTLRCGQTETYRRSMSLPTSHERIERVLRTVSEEELHRPRHAPSQSSSKDHAYDMAVDATSSRARSPLGDCPSPPRTLPSFSSVASSSKTKRPKYRGLFAKWQKPRDNETSEVRRI